jgi:predicted molibdopterin-dependent oxidoreductase YjgC
LTNEEAFVLQHLFRAIGVRNLDWRAGRQRQATPGARSAPLAALERAQVIVIAGESPEERAPVMWLRVRKAVSRAGAKLIQGSAPRDARNAAGDAARVALIWDGVDLASGREYAQAFGDVADLSTYITSEQGNARGAEAMGMLPRSGPGYQRLDGGRDTFGMFEDARNGKLAVLSIFGANPLRNAPDPAAIANALDAIPFLVVSELFMTETARHATLVLPVKSAFEKNGTTIGLAGDVLAVNASLAAPEVVLSDFELLLGLAERLDVVVPSLEELDHAVIGHAARVPQDFTFGDERFESEQKLAPRNGRVSRILSGGGTWLHDPRLAGLRV